MVKRGDVYWARLDQTEGSEQAGTRPVVIVSRNAINENSPIVVIAPTTAHSPKKRLYPSQVLLRRGEGGLPNDSILLGEQIRAISKSRLSNYLGRLSSSKVTEVSAALKIALDL